MEPQESRLLTSHTILQSYSHQNSMAVRTKQASGTGKKPRPKPKHGPQSVYDKGGRLHIKGEKTTSLVNGAGKMGQLHVKK